jgi:hypothetical protein
MLFVNTIKHTAYFHNCVQLPLQITNNMRSTILQANSKITLQKGLLRANWYMRTLILGQNALAPKAC